MIKKIFLFIIKINRKRLFSFIFLFFPPVVFCISWYLFEYEEWSIFYNLEVRGTNLTLNSSEEISALTNLPNALYNETKDVYPVQFEKPKGISEFENFKSEVSRKLTENIGIFSSLPIYSVCLVNNNKIFLNGVVQDNLELSKGAASIKQEKGYEFYALRGKKDCKNVVIGKFRDSRSRVEYGYVFWTLTNSNGSDSLKNEKFSISIATSSVDASKTRITVSLNIWVIFLSYFLTLFAWSFIFFQYEKIYSYFAEELKK